jgi:hypothetical protein
MPIVPVEMLVIGLVVIVLVAVLARMTWLIAHREGGASITEAQARANAAPLTTAILGPEQSQPQGTSFGPAAPELAESRRSRNVGKRPTTAVSKTRSQPSGN